MPAQVYLISSLGAPIHSASMADVPWTEWHKPVAGMKVWRCMAPHSIAIGLV